MNVDQHEGRRTTVVLLSAAVIGIAAVGATYWVFNGLVSSPAVGASQALLVTPGSTDTTIPDVPTTSVTTIVVPSPTGIPFTPSPVSVAPPELPTMTAPVASETTDPSASGPSTPTPPTAPTAPTAPTTSPPTVPAPSTTTPAISGVSMFCRKNGDRVEGGLTFRTTTTVPVSLFAGGKVEQRPAAGPGVVSVTAAGKRGSFCMATVGSQRFGPMSAS